MIIKTTSKSLFLRRILSAIVMLAFMANTAGISYAQAALNLPVPGTQVNMSPVFTPALLKAVKVSPENPFQFEFIVDVGSAKLSETEIKTESEKLIRYFLASLTIPENDLWVNLSPYEKDRIVPQSFGVTEMGRDLLGEDYILKQLSASLTKPDTDLGKRYWEQVNKSLVPGHWSLENTNQAPGTNHQEPSLSKVWIVPQKAVVYENGPTAYVSETKLKVMMEEEYEKKSLVPGSSSLVNARQAQGTNHQEPSTDVFRQLILPQIEQDVNEGKNFATVRQIYNSLILANWYKKRLKDSILAQIYVDKKKVAGVDIDDKAEAQKIYNRYLEAFKKGAYNYIKEDYDPAIDEMIPRKYFSGGFGLTGSSSIVTIIKGVPPKVSLSAKNLFRLLVGTDMTRDRKGRRQIFRTAAAGAMLATVPGISIARPDQKLVDEFYVKKTKADQALLSTPEFNPGNYKVAQDYLLELKKKYIDLRSDPVLQNPELLEDKLIIFSTLNNINKMLVEILGFRTKDTPAVQQNIRMYMEFNDKYDRAFSNKDRDQARSDLSYVFVKITDLLKSGVDTGELKPYWEEMLASVKVTEKDIKSSSAVGIRSGLSGLALIGILTFSPAALADDSSLEQKAAQSLVAGGYTKDTGNRSQIEQFSTFLKGFEESVSRPIIYFNLNDTNVDRNYFKIVHDWKILKAWSGFLPKTAEGDELKARLAAAGEALAKAAAENKAAEISYAQKIAMPLPADQVTGIKEIDDLRMLANNFASRDNYLTLETYRELMLLVDEVIRDNPNPKLEKSLKQYRESLREIYRLGEHISRAREIYQALYAYYLMIKSGISKIEVQENFDVYRQELARLSPDISRIDGSGIGDSPYQTAVFAPGFRYLGGFESPTIRVTAEEIKRLDKMFQVMIDAIDILADYQELNKSEQTPKARVPVLESILNRVNSLSNSANITDPGTAGFVQRIKDQVENSLNLDRVTLRQQELRNTGMKSMFGALFMGGSVSITDILNTIRLNVGRIGASMTLAVSLAAVPSDAVATVYMPHLIAAPVANIVSSEIKESLSTLALDGTIDQSSLNQSGNDVGGIDLTAGKTPLEIRARDNKDFRFQFTPAQIKNIQIDGLVPVIINITPEVNLPMFLSENSTAPAEAVASIVN